MPQGLRKKEGPLDVVATRVLDVDGKPGFEVRLGRPRSVQGANGEGDSWCCDFDLDGPITKYRGLAVGEDSIQALLCAVYMIQMLVETCDENRAGRLTLDGHNRHFGFPRSDTDPYVQEYRSEFERLHPGRLDGPPDP